MELRLKLLVYFVFSINTAIAFTYGFRFLREKKPKVNTIKIIYFILASSIVWSLGMGVMSVHTPQGGAYYWRVFGISGTFCFMIGIQKLLCVISTISRKYQKIMDGVAYLGIPIFLLYIQPGQTIFVDSLFGTSFYFKFGWVTIVYGLYFTIVSTDILLVTLYMVRKHKLASVRAIGRRFIVVECLVYIGAIFDMFLPCFGITAIPGSAVTHFWGVIVLWYAVHEMFKSEITVANMSEYIFYSLDIPVLIFDYNKNMRIMNDAASLFFNIPAVDENIHIEDLFLLEGNIYEFEGRSNTFNANCNRNESKCQLSVSKIQDKYNDIIGYILIVNDLSEHYLNMERLAQAKKDADEANMSKSVFLANMSHEIRTPMNAIIGFTDLALKEKIDGVSQEFFSDIKRSSETLLSIINDILNISKIELGNHELKCSNYKSAKLFNDVSVIIGVQSKEKALTYETIIDENFPKELHADVDKLREILINILNNAVKYTKRGGVIFKARALDLKDGIANIEYRISDSGIGIKEEDMERIFEKFSRVDAGINSETEGTGLGLSITKGLVDMMGGTIEVKSEYGVGTEFIITIPQKVIDESPINLEEIEKVDNNKKKLVFDNAKFLAVDDNRVNLKVISKVLEQYGIVYDLANSGIEAIDMCKNNQYDVVLMDQMMPVMDGVEAMKKIRMLPGYEKGSQTKIVALTANVIEGVEEQLMTEGFDGFIGKPINLKKFESVICSVMTSGKYHYEDVVD